MSRVHFDSRRTSVDPSQTQLGRVIRVERILTSGLFESVRTITCMVVEFNLPGGDRILPCKCDNLPTVDHFLVQEGDKVLVTARDFDGGTITALALSIVWEQPVLIEPDHAKITESGTVLRTSKVILSDGISQRTRAILACKLLNGSEKQHVVVFQGDPQEHIELALCVPGQPVEVSFCALPALNSAQVSLRSLKLDFSHQKEQ